MVLPLPTLINHYKCFPCLYATQYWKVSPQGDELKTKILADWYQAIQRDQLLHLLTAYLSPIGFLTRNWSCLFNIHWAPSRPSLELNPLLWQYFVQFKFKVVQPSVMCLSAGSAFFLVGLVVWGMFETMFSYQIRRTMLTFNVCL